MTPSLSSGEISASPPDLVRKSCSRSFGKSGPSINQSRIYFPLVSFTGDWAWECVTAKTNSNNSVLDKRIMFLCMRLISTHQVVVGCGKFTRGIHHPPQFGDVVIYKLTGMPRLCIKNIQIRSTPVKKEPRKFYRTGYRQPGVLMFSFALTGMPP